MSQPRFLADHDFNGKVINGLKRREPAIVLLLARDLGLSQSPDPTLLEYAAGDGLIVLSHDRNTLIGFARQRIQAGLRMPGLFVARQFVVKPVIESVLELWAASDAEEWEGHIGHLPL